MNMNLKLWVNVLSFLAISSPSFAVELFNHSHRPYKWSHSYDEGVLRAGEHTTIVTLDVYNDLLIIKPLILGIEETPYSFGYSINYVNDDALPDWLALGRVSAYNNTLIPNPNDTLKSLNNLDSYYLINKPVKGESFVQILSMTDHEFDLNKTIINIWDNAVVSSLFFTVDNTSSFSNIASQLTPPEL